MISQLHANLGGDVRKVLEAFDRKNASAGHIGDVGQQRGAVQLLRSPATITKRVKDANRIELGVRLFHQPLDIALVVPTMIVTPIGYDEQGPFGVLGTPHLAEPKIDCIEQSRSTLRGRHHHAALQILDAVCEFTGKLRSFVEADQEKFVGGVGGLEKLQRRFPRLADFVAHAPADVKNHADGNGHIFGGKGLDLLLYVIFKNAEVVRLEAGDEPVVGICHRDVDQSEADIAAQYPAGLDGQAGGIVLDVVGFIRLWSGRVVAGSLWERNRPGSKQEQANNKECEATIDNADASSLASHGSPVSRLAGTAARFGLQGGFYHSFLPIQGEFSPYGFGRGKGRIYSPII